MSNKISSNEKGFSAFFNGTQILRSPFLRPELFYSKSNNKLFRETHRKKKITILIRRAYKKCHSTRAIQELSVNHKMCATM